MAKINGSLLLVYADGTLIASQKNVTVNWEQDLPDASTKDSTGWEEHINGTRRATVDFDCLYDTSGLSAEDLMDYIINRTNLVLVIDGTGVPIVGEATVKNITVNAVTEEPASLSGSFKFKGPAWMLTGVFAKLFNGWSNDTYETFTSSDLMITSAIETGTSGSAYTNPNFSVTTGDVIKVITYLTLNSGVAPTIKIDSGAGALSNLVVLTAGVNVATLTVTGNSANGKLFVINAAAGNWSTTNIYAFKS